jgi:hypothetical protein
MRKDYEKLFSYFKPAEPSVGLFNRIILAIKQEKELQETKRRLFGFSALLVISLIVTLLSGTMLAIQLKNSGILYFISATFSDFETFLVLWQDFSLAILESLPLAGILFFTISLGISIFTLRLFFYRKRLLLGCLMQSFALKNK